MTGAEGTMWFIDAWAVHDGRVFASRRPRESISADATVFMSVPDLEAVPVGRISTALRATRSGFQEGLRTNDGDAAEIPFRDLRQVRDLVRRGYLTAGLGPEAPGAIAGPVPRPEVGPGPGGAYLESEFADRDGRWDLVYLHLSDPPYEIDWAVSTVAKATILEWDRHLLDQDPEEIRGLVGWLGALRSAGILEMAGESAGSPFPMSLLHLADEYEAGHLRKALRLIRGTWEPGYPFEIGDRISGYWSRSHLAIVPLPVAPGWSHQVRRFADMSLLPVVDRRFWESPPGVTSLDLAPLVLCHALRQPARSGRIPGEPSVAQAAYQRARESLAWLKEIKLPSEAESVLAEFIDSCLAGPPTGAPTGAPVPKTPSGPSSVVAKPAWEPPPMSASAG
jgi:hypothetical protein